jgi:diguanylate cyclase (GGDEF)-like protein
MTLAVGPFWIVGALWGFIFGTVVLLVRRDYPNYLRRALEFLGAANLALAFNYLLRIAGPRLGPFVFDVLPSTLVVASLALEYQAICKLKQRASSSLLTIVPPSFMFTVGIWFTILHRNITIQLFLLNVLDAGLMLLVGMTLMRPEGGKRPFVDAMASVTYFVLGLVVCAVIVDYLKTGTWSVEYDYNTWRSLSNNVASIVAEAVVFPLFLLIVAERLNRDLIVKAMRDPLTGLYNRRAFEDIAFRELSGAARTGLGISLVVFDVDRLKTVNDSFGHAVGDAVLLATAGALRAGLRDEDYLCRWGGDEFCALLPRANLEQSQGVVDRIHQSLKNIGFRHDGKLIEITVSTGIVTDQGRARDLASLLKQADDALYQAKGAGRNQSVATSYRTTV